MDNENLQKLRESAMFQLSLGSKELFHSNFLFWVATFSPKMFQELIMSLFEKANTKSSVASWPELFEISREYHHFDLCVTDKDKKVLLVIENKVKSIPNKQQLDEYRWKSREADHLLLSLVGNDFPDHEEVNIEYNKEEQKSVIADNPWAIVNYKVLADSLSEIVGDKSGYEYEIIRDYIGFIKIFADLADEWRKYFKEDGSTKSYEFRNKDYEDLRISDIYQKILYSQILGQTITRLKETDPTLKNFNRKHAFHDDNLSKSGADTLYVNSGMTNSTGFLEVKVKYRPDIAILIQVQGNQYRRCIEFSNNKKDADKWKSLKENIEWIREKAPASMRQYFALERNSVTEMPYPPEMPYPRYIGSGFPYRSKKDDAQDGFCKFGSRFIYQYIKIDAGKTIDDVVKAIVEDVISFRVIIGNDTAD